MAKRHQWAATGDLIDKRHDATCTECGLRKTRGPGAFSFELIWPDGEKHIHQQRVPECGAPSPNKERDRRRERPERPF